MWLIAGNYSIFLTYRRILHVYAQVKSFLLEGHVCLNLVRSDNLLVSTK
jgi:hypothetical protein